MLPRQAQGSSATQYELLLDRERAVAVWRPTDEFDREIAAVVAQIPRIGSPTDAAHVLSRVFSSAFEPNRFRPERCAAAGADLYAALLTQELLT